MLGQNYLKSSCDKVEFSKLKRTTFPAQLKAEKVSLLETYKFRSKVLKVFQILFRLKRKTKTVVDRIYIEAIKIRVRFTEVWVFSFFGVSLISVGRSLVFNSGKFCNHPYINAKREASMLSNVA
jgi:hypothetical protein